MSTFKFIPLSMHAMEIKINLFFHMRNESMVEFSWSDFADELSVFRYLNDSNRCLLDVLHTVIDGYTLEYSDKRLTREKRYRIKKEVKQEIFRDIYEYEMMRSNLAYTFIKQDLATPTDYAHFLKLHAVNHDTMPQKEIPKHLKVLKDKEYYKDKAEFISKAVASMSYNLFKNQDSLYLKTAFPNYLESESGLGRKKYSELDMPEFIRSSVVDIIETDMTKKEVAEFHDINPRTFDRNWEKYKFQAFKNYIFNCVFFNEEQNEDNKRMDKRISKSYRKVKARSDYGITQPSYTATDIVFTFPYKQLYKIKKYWGFKDLDSEEMPNTLVLYDYR